ncbi:MAG: nicotinamide riboside transporter PnuC [Agarilytica sp.]
MLDTFITIFTEIAIGFSEKDVWELIAVLLALAYLVLALRESIWCWPAAFISTAIYTGLFWHVSLLMDSALNVYYMAMAVYGGWVWRAQSGSTAVTTITTWPWRWHATVILAIVVASALSGYLLDQNTEAAWPYLDSFTTWASVITTYMVAKKVLENWCYWIVIDSVALGLYIERGLYPTAFLLVIYLVICVFGYFSWRKIWLGSSAAKIRDNNEHECAALSL